MPSRVTLPWRLAVAAALPDGYSYRDLYPSAPQNCGEAGVIGILPGVIGTLQASEAIKLITGIGTPLSGTLLVFDALAATFIRFSLSKQSAVLEFEDDTSEFEISREELAQTISSENPPVIIDVRDIGERILNSIGGLHIPLASLPQKVQEFRSEQCIVVYCQSGLRSAKAALYLRSVLPFTKVFNLRGGLNAGRNHDSLVNVIT